MQFSQIGKCDICRSPGEHFTCSAIKIWEFDDLLRDVTVYHQGKHNVECSLKPVDRKLSEEIKNYYGTNRNATPTEAAQSVLSEKLDEDKEIDWDEIEGKDVMEP